MNIGGIGNKILNPIEKNSEVIGGGLAALERVENIKQIVAKAASGSIHMPNFSNWLTQVANAPQYQSAGIAALLAYLAKDAVPNSTLKKVASAVQKAGVSYVFAGAMIDLGYWATHNDAGCRNPGANMNIKGGSSYNSQLVRY